ncbi:MAG TPA: SigE family RNA polymerase sigma factor [Micromonosporaceae bacterium]
MVRPSFEEYVTARSGMLLRFAYLLCGDRHLAEDLVQEVLIKSHRRWLAIEAENPDAYLRQALVRTHVTWLRRRSSTEITTDTFRDDAGGGGFADDQATRDELWTLLAKLPRAQRAVLVLRYFEDLDDARIAEVVGVSASTVRVHAHRGLQSLRETLAVHAQEAPTGAGMLDTVRRGAARAALRRRALAAGGLAVIVAALALLLPILGPGRDPGPTRPTPTITPSSPSPNPTSTLALVQTTVTAPTLPYAFTYLPPNVGDSTVERVGSTIYLHFDKGLSIGVGPDGGFWGDPGESAVSTQTTVNGQPATRWTTPGVPNVVLQWQQDGRYLMADADGTTVTEIELRRFADGLAPGSTAGTKADPLSALASVGLPEGYPTIQQWAGATLCFAPDVAGSNASVCFSLAPLPAYSSQPHTDDFTIDGAPAFTVDGAPGHPVLIVERADGRTITIQYNWDVLDLTTPDLIAIYRSMIFR